LDRKRRKPFGVWGFLFSPATPMGWAQIMNFNPNFAAGETSHVLSQAKLRWGVRSVDELRWGVISWKPRKTWVSSFTKVFGLVGDFGT